MFKWIKRFKSAITGRFVKKSEALASPTTTVAVRRRRTNQPRALPKT